MPTQCRPGLGPEGRASESTSHSHSTPKGRQLGRHCLPREVQSLAACAGAPRILENLPNPSERGHLLRRCLFDNECCGPILLIIISRRVDLVASTIPDHL